LPVGKFPEDGYTSEQRLSRRSRSMVSSIYSFLKQTVQEFLDDRCMRMGAALAYYTIFSLPPLLVLLVTLVSVIYGGQAAREVVADQVSQFLGPASRDQLLEMMGQADQQAGFGWIFSLALIAFGATAVLMELQYTLNEVWDVQPDPEQAAWKTFITKRILSLGMVLAVAFLLLVSLILTSILQTLGDRVGTMIGLEIGSAGATAIHLAVNVVVITLLFAAMFKFLPDADIPWKTTWVGAAVTAGLFLLGKFLLGLYFAYVDVAGQFGQAAASLVLILVWIYYSSLIFLFGAEFTQVWAQRYHGGIQPEEGAVKVVEEKRLERNWSTTAGGEDTPSQPSPTRQEAS
jgi:membrane protein